MKIIKILVITTVFLSFSGCSQSKNNWECEGNKCVLEVTNQVFEYDKTDKTIEFCLEYNKVSPTYPYSMYREHYTYDILTGRLTRARNGNDSVDFSFIEGELVQIQLDDSTERIVSDEATGEYLFICYCGNNQENVIETDCDNSDEVITIYNELLGMMNDNPLPEK